MEFFEQLNRTFCCKTADLLMKLLYRLGDERLLIFRQFLKIDLEDGVIVHVDDCCSLGVPRNMLTQKKRAACWSYRQSSKLGETAWSGSQNLPGLRKYRTGWSRPKAC
jgi:hypothetical protein